MAPEGLEGRLGTATVARAALLEAANAVLARRLPPAPAAEARAFLALWAEGVADDDLLARAPEDVAGAALSLLEHARRRAAGTANVRCFKPRPDRDGWRSAHAVAEIVTDDMPFLVDSALAALARANRAVHLVVHPIVPVRRDAAGRLLAFGPAAGEGAARESMMQIEFAEPAEASELGPIADSLARTMADVRRAVEDWPAMRARLAQVTARLAERDEEPFRIARDFLAWLDDDNFVFLGWRGYALDEAGRVHPEQDEALGLLRDPALPVFDVLRDPHTIPEPVRAWALEPVPLTVAKANMRSTVHRPQHCDAIVLKRIDRAGRVRGADIVLGLFAASAYNRNPRSIPYLREKVAAVLARAGLDPATHDGRRLSNILETYPRDELFQADVAELHRTAQGILALQERQRVALFLRRDRFERFVSALVFVPRDVMDTRLRIRLGEILARAFAGRLSATYIQIGDAPLARIHYIVATTPGAVPEVEAKALERVLAEAARSFRDRLAEALAAEAGEGAAQATLARWGEAFPPGYAERHGAREAVADIALAEAALARGGLVLALARPQGVPGFVLQLRLARPDEPVPLSDILPLIECLGLRAIEEVPFRLAPAAGRAVVLHEFALETADRAAIEPERIPRLAAALEALAAGRAEADGFNRLVLRAGLTWREAWLLRALWRWLKQVGVPFAQGAAEEALAANAEAAAALIRLFRLRFDPDQERNPEDEAAEEARWQAILDAVADPEHDRILARLRAALDAVLRTSFFRDEAAEVLALKLDPARAGDIPRPVPWREIFVHGPRIEGVHLRAGAVARGGIRWSDRREDFRTEILGLMKAQTLKNTVIVPTGAKGGFVVRRPPAPSGDAARDREAVAAEGVACYRLFIGALLDLTDNRDGERIAPPARVVCRDGPDPYLVAAADKGTAAFSDIANALALARGFWLGDAFASGGSKGYDHKKLGVTARGAFVCIARHFREEGIDIARDPIDVVGVGDMSGDVFGNFMLLSRAFRLRAAFDHRHIFLDPDPDPEVAHAERARLFHLPRSAWADYDPAKLSPGGGVFPRTAKTIPLSPQARAVLGLDAERATPEAVIRAILAMPCDLLYFGGIGTFIKASNEAHAAAGDRANDAIRIDAASLRCRVVGEGANLALTQAARIEAALRGIRVDADSLHNSAGVDTSDHEVNLKILLDGLVRAGDLTPKQRDGLLCEATEDVVAQVLATNRRQSLGLSLEMGEGVAATPAHAALIARLEAEAGLDRSVAALPDPATLAARGTLTRPELVVLLAHAKLWLTDAILASDLPDDRAFGEDLAAYFPSAVRTRFADAIAAFPLRRELLAMLLANDLLDRLGLAAFARLADGIAPAEAARAALIARAALGLDGLRRELEAEDVAGASPDALYPRLAALRRAQEGSARWVLRNAPSGGVAEVAAPFRDRAEALLDDLLAHDPPGEAAGMALPILALSAELGAPVERVRETWFEVGAACGLEAVRKAAAAIVPADAWTARALAALADDLGAAQTRLVRAALQGGGVDAVRAAAGARWTAVQGVLSTLGASPSLGQIVVAARAIGALA
ncbi:NAD-glutamate dehydrogenase [Elioraea thermophila]|uniref:NAD-glutamate dehydrogenase n=1 Tax=Elioraea thermophila TaxID=2185104 RepID=UPI000DF351F9|nr:NAD-glutamate dehydrogenase domain-containing protein [Elioraea thermophila]